MLSLGDNLAFSDFQSLDFLKKLNFAQISMVESLGHKNVLYQISKIRDKNKFDTEGSPLLDFSGEKFQIFKSILKSQRRGLGPILDMKISLE